MSYPSSSDNAAILASALTSLTGSPIIALSDYLNQRVVNGNNSTYQNISPVSLDSLHNSYLSGGAVSTNPTNSQQNNDNLNTISCSSSYDHYYWSCLAIPNYVMYPQQDTLQDTPQQIPQQIPQHQIPQQIPPHHPIPLPQQIPHPIP